MTKKKYEVHTMNLQALFNRFRTTISHSRIWWWWWSRLLVMMMTMHCNGDHLKWWLWWLFEMVVKKMRATPDDLSPIIFQLTLRTWRTRFIINILPKPIKLVNAKKNTNFDLPYLPKLPNKWNVEPVKNRASWISEPVRVGIDHWKIWQVKSNWWCQHMIIMMIK